MPRLGITTAAYEDEAAHAMRRVDDLEAMREALDAFPVAPELTLYGLLSAQIAAGEKIGELLTHRADATAEEESRRTKQIGALRSETIGDLNRFRETLSHEMSANPDLPNDLEMKIFALYDQLNTSCEERRPRPTPQTEPEQAAQA